MKSRISLGGMEVWGGGSESVTFPGLGHSKRDLLLLLLCRGCYRLRPRRF